MLELYNDDPSPGQVPTPQSAAEHIAEILAPTTPHRLALAFKEATPIGLAAVGFFLSINEAQKDRRRQMELKELFVMPTYRSAGVGKTLMDWVEKQAARRGVHRIDWHVKSGNARGIAFYKHLGGEIVDDRLSMRKLRIFD